MKTVYTKIFKTAIFIMAVLFVISTSCHREEPKAVVLVKNTGMEFPVKLMMIDTLGPIAIDSLTDPSHKDFKFIISVSEPSAFIIQSSGFQTGFILSDGDTAIVDAAMNDYPGMKANKDDIFSEYIQIMESFDKQADSLSDIYTAAQVTDSFALVREKVNKAFNNLILEARYYATGVIHHNPESIMVFVAINSSVKQTPVFNYSVTPEIFYYADSVMQKNNPSHRYSIRLHNRLLQLKSKYGTSSSSVIRIHEGNILPQIKLPGLSDNIVVLKPSVGKTTLVYLWDENPESRKATARVKMLDEEYKSRGFVIYAIAFTSNHRNWTSLIELDKMWWNNVIDTTASGSSLLVNYNIRRLPYFILIDEKRKVLAHFGSAEAMEEWLVLYFMKENKKELN